MKYLYALCLSVLFLISAGCEEEEVNQTCTGPQPAERIAWLKTMAQELQTSEYCQVIHRGFWREKTVFVVTNCDPAINSISPVFDCDGNLLCYRGDESSPNFDREVASLAVVWRNGK